MGRTVHQYCHAHKIMEDYPACDNGLPGNVASRNAQLGPKDRPVVWEHPETGEVRYPPRQESPMLPAYKERGFKRREFTSYREHQDWCKAHGVVNHAAEDIK
jgi:hypothetical protein